MKILMRVGAVVVAIVSCLVLTTTAATAGQTKEWDDSKLTSEGYAKAKVRVDFLGKRVVDFEGWVEDVCPKDGHGAYLHLAYQVRVKDTHELQPFHTAHVFRDSNGCGNGLETFDPAPHKSDPNTVLYAVRFDLCYEDADGHGSGAVYGDGCVDRVFKNWRVH